VSAFPKLIFVKTASTEGKPKWIIAFLLLIGLGLLSLAGYNIYKNLTTPWHLVTGYVESSEVVKHTTSDGVTWSPLVLYNYTYLGKHFEGTYRLGYSSSDYGESQRVVSRYPPGTKIQVKVNPSNLSDSRIKQDFFSENSEWLFVSALGLVFTLFPMLIYFGSKKTQ